MFRRLLPIALVGFLAACGGTTSETAEPAAPTNSVALTDAPVPEAPATAAPLTAAPPTAAPETPAPIPANVPEALQFTAPLLGGGDIEMATLASRPVLLWFWAPW